MNYVSVLIGIFKLSLGKGLLHEMENALLRAFSTNRHGKIRGSHSMLADSLLV